MSGEQGKTPPIKAKWAVRGVGRGTAYTKGEARCLPGLCTFAFYSKTCMEGSCAVSVLSSVYVQKITVLR